jgi:hypothetical protein
MVRETLEAYETSRDMFGGWTVSATFADTREKWRATRWRSTNVGHVGLMPRRSDVLVEHLAYPLRACSTAVGLRARMRDRMSPRTSLRPLIVLTGIGAAISAVHCSSSDSKPTGSSCAFSNADPTTIRQLTADQQALVTRVSDHTKAALSAAEWRYLFKLRYAFFPRATVETDPVVVKALAAIAQATPSCAATNTGSADACDRFANVGRCWNHSPVNAATVPCLTWSMMVAGHAGCSMPTSAATAPVDSQAWDDAQDGKDTDDCEAPCFAGGGCSHGVCKCAADEAPCAGGCGRTKSDVANCGGCGNVCGASTPCVEGVCGGSADAGSDASDGG